uniref:Apoptosis inhibitor 5 n=1 Tax=Cyprinus carpio carpio TaxID=630221 RepID=A0A9J8CDV2_CYPCA
MAATVEELYRNYGVLADAKEDLSKHKDAYQVILDGVKGGPKEKRLAAQFIPKFFSSFPELADAAINAQLDLCEDEDVSIRRQAIKELPRFASGENLPRVADILTQLLQTDDSAEFSQVNTALISIFKIDAKGTLGGLFSQILQGEDVVRERAIKFLSTKLKTMPDDTMTKEVEDYIFIETKKVLEDVTGEEFVLLMRILSGLKNMQTVSGRQQLVELVVEQAFLEQALNPTDADSVDRLLQCTRQALPLFSKNVHSTRFVTYFCEFVLPSLSLLTSPVAELDIQLEVLKLLAEMSPYCGDMDKLEVNLNMLFEKLLEFMPLPPEEENGENAANEEPKLQFSYVECLLFSFHQLGKKLPDFLIDKISAEKLKDFKIRLQYFARGLQVYIRQLRVALQGKTGDALKTEENKIKVVALKITNNINVLIKDLFHNPPSYKSTVTLSWKPVQKTEAAAIGYVYRSTLDIQITMFSLLMKVFAMISVCPTARRGSQWRTLGQQPQQRSFPQICPGGTPDKYTIRPAGNTAPALGTSLTNNEEASGAAEDGASEEEATEAEAGFIKRTAYASKPMQLHYHNILSLTEFLPSGPSCIYSPPSILFLSTVFLNFILGCVFENPFSVSCHGYPVGYKCVGCFSFWIIFVEQKTAKVYFLFWFVF